MVADSPHKIFIGGLPNYLQEEQVLFILVALQLPSDVGQCIGWQPRGVYSGIMSDNDLIRIT